jgi:PIN domain nuclease of toxin-antitoxin system
MRVLLDTNILVFMWTGQNEITKDTESIIGDYSVSLLTSSVCVAELMHLCQIGKIDGKHGAKKSASDVLSWLDSVGIDIVYLTRANLDAFSSLALYDGHRDPNDRVIIAQAISDKIPLVSSDRKFNRYERDGLDFVFNDR